MITEPEDYIPRVQMHTGKVFNLIDPRAEDVDIEDIAHSLGMLCRYGGHSDSFYSVGEHCVVMSKFVSYHAKFHALIHDAAEAYVTDLPRPLKWLFPRYRELEDEISDVIYEYLGVDTPSPEIKAEIKLADWRMCLTERAQLMDGVSFDWVCDNQGIEPFDYTLMKWYPTQAKRAYLEKFKELMEEVSCQG